VLVLVVVVVVLLLLLLLLLLRWCALEVFMDIICRKDLLEISRSRHSPVRAPLINNAALGVLLPSWLFERQGLSRRKLLHLWCWDVHELPWG